MKALALILALASAAQAAAPNPYWTKGKALFAKQRFAEALAQLELARQVPSQDVDSRIEILELLARAQMAEGQRPQAETSYAEILSLRPHWAPPPDLAPKILDAFDAAKRRKFPSDFVEVKVGLALATQLSFELVDPWHQVTALVGNVRREGETSWTERTLVDRDGSYSLALPASASTTLEWYVEARGPAGEVLAGVGTAEAPKRVVGEQASPLPPATVRRSRVVPIVLAGVAVLAAGGAAYLQTRSSAAEQRAISEEWSDTARSEHAGAVNDARWSIALMATAGAAGGGALFLFAF